MRQINILLLSLLMFLLCSCAEDKREIVYIYDLEQKIASFTPQDYQLITNYLIDHDCQLGGARTFKAPTLEKCDSLCAKYMRKKTSKLKYEELDALGLSSGATFTYSAWRYKDPEHPDRTNPETGFVDRVFVGRFYYPKR